MNGLTVVLSGEILNNHLTNTPERARFTIKVIDKQNTRYTGIFDVRFHDSGNGEPWTEKDYIGGYTAGLIDMLDAITEEDWSAHMVDLTLQMQQEGKTTIEETFTV